MITDKIEAQTVVPTFNSLGIYFPVENDSMDLGEIQVRYKTEIEKEWHNALPLWFDRRNNEYRGSIVHLKSATQYEIELVPQDSLNLISLSATTWTEEFPIVDTVFIPAHSATTYKINRSGTKDGYVLYTGFREDSLTIIDVEKKFETCIEVAENTSYVIIRGLMLKGARQHGIRLMNNVHDIVIEKNDISQWGTNAEDGWGMNRNSGIFSAKKHPNIERIIIQRNHIHHPSTTANSWEEKRENGSFHPSGPQAIHLAETNGNHVIRYNEIYSDSAHYFNDAIGAAENFSFRGFPNRDTDINGNKISHCWDDGIESEGGNCNVRIWGNYIDKTFVKIAIASTSVGPLYIWRNVANSSRKSALENSSDKFGRGPFIKAGGRTIDSVFYGAGKTYIFHNTVYQEEASAGILPLGSGNAIQSSGGYLYNLVSRNNIFLNYKPWQSSFLIRADSCTNDFDYDIYNGSFQNVCKFDHHQKNGIKLGNKKYYIFDTLNAEFHYFLADSSVAVDAGIVLPNFNDNFHGKAPDLGAFESGHDAIEFGVNAHLEGKNISPDKTILFLFIGLILMILIIYRLKIVAYFVKKS